MTKTQETLQQGWHQRWWCKCNKKPHKFDSQRPAVGNNAQSGHPIVKMEIRDSSQISTTAPIFLLSNYFRQKYLEIASCTVSLLNNIWVQVGHSLLQQLNLRKIHFLPLLMTSIKTIFGHLKQYFHISNSIFTKKQGLKRYFEGFFKMLLHAMWHPVKSFCQ